MANPLKVLVDLQARQNVAVSGNLEVTGTTALGTITGSALKVNGAAVITGGLTVTGSSLLASVSASSNAQIGGTLTVGGVSSLGVVTSSAQLVNGDATVTGNLVVTGTSVLSGAVTIHGNLDVKGTTTSISATNLVISDKLIVVGDGATNAAQADGAGFTIGSTTASFKYDQSGWFISTENLNIASGKDPKIAGTSVLSATELKNGVVSASLAYNNSSLNVVGAVTASGDIKGGAKVYAATTGTLSHAAAATGANGLDIADAIRLLDSAIVGGGVTAADVNAEYESVRHRETGSFSAGEAVITLNNTKFPTASIDFVSLDVMVKSGSGDWENDLVSVAMKVTGSNIQVTIGALSDVDTYRLIAVNEASGAFTLV